MNAHYMSYEDQAEQKLSLEVVEDDYGNIKIKDHTGLSDLPYISFLNEIDIKGWSLRLAPRPKRLKKTRLASF